MANFPSSLPALTTGHQTGDVIDAVDINNPNDEINAIAAKVGTTSSAVITSHEYKISNNASIDPGHRHSTLYRADNNGAEVFVLSSGNVQIGNFANNSSAKLQIDSSTSGFLPPRMTTTNRDAINSVATGLVIYNSTIGQLEVYNGTAWVGLTPRKVVTLTDAATIATDAALGNEFRVQLAAGVARTLGAPTNLIDGRRYIWRIQQPTSGAASTLSYDSIFRFGSDVGTPTLSTANSKADYIGGVYNQTDTKIDILAVVKGY